MRKVAVALTTPDRMEKHMPLFLESAKEHDAFRGGWEVMLLAQGCTTVQRARLLNDPNVDVLADIWFTDEVESCTAGRMKTMQRWWPSDLWLVLDDDMVFTSETRYFSQFWQEYCFQPGVGTVSAPFQMNRGWHDKMVRRTEKRLGCRLEEVDWVEMEGKPKPQRGLNTEGGLMYSHEVAQCFRGMTEEELGCSYEECIDDNSALGLRAYTEGYLHYHFLGSWCIHPAGSAGGVKAYMEKAPREIPYERFYDLCQPSCMTCFRWAEGQCRCRSPIAESSRGSWKAKLLPEAHELHRKNRQRLLKKD